jgi:hypothetical protein
MRRALFRDRPTQPSGPLPKRRLGPAKRHPTYWSKAAHPKRHLKARRIRLLPLPLPRLRLRFKARLRPGHGLLTLTPAGLTPGTAGTSTVLLPLSTDSRTPRGTMVKAHTALTKSHPRAPRIGEGVGQRDDSDEIQPRLQIRGSDEL